MLKIVASFVLSRVSRCGVAQGYASLATLPAASLDDYFEHPAMLAFLETEALAVFSNGERKGKNSRSTQRCRLWALANDHLMYGDALMKYMLLVHHDEEAFSKLSETTQEQCLRNLCKLMHQLHANGQYLSASPLHPASTAAIAQVSNQFMTNTHWNGRSPATD